MENKEEIGSISCEIGAFSHEEGREEGNNRNGGGRRGAMRPEALMPSVGFTKADWRSGRPSDMAPPIVGFHVAKGPLIIFHMDD